MGVICNSICINEEIVKISCNPREEKLSQGIVYDRDSMSFVKNINQKVLFSLNPDKLIEKGSCVLIDLPDLDLSCAYRINDDNTVSEVSHLYIEMVSGKYIFLANEDIDSYRNILYNIPENLVKGLFVKLNDKYFSYSKEEISNILRKI